MELLLKPSQAAKSITGTIALKKTRFSNIKTFTLAAQGAPGPTNPASLLASLSDSSESNIPVTAYQANTGFVVQTFEYFHREDGIWQANLIAPSVEGEYQITTAIQYQNAAVPPAKTTLVMLIDPEGYVYTQLKEGRLRIQNATVSIWQLDSKTKTYVLWDAQSFNQQNPIITDETGRYTFLVPPGNYYLKAEAKNFNTWQSYKFPVRENNSLHIDIPLKKKNWWQRIFGG